MVLVTVWFLLVASALATSPIRPKSPPIKIPTRPPVEAHCGKDEKYVSNSTACRVTCANRDFQDSSGGCKPFSGCVCKDDLVRLNDDATGACVTKDQCPPSCPKGERYVKDTNLCDKTCGNRDIYHVMGPCQPCSKCVCSGDLIRLNDDGTGPCVSEDQCPNTQCGPNEIWSKIKITCPPQSCMSLYFPPPCAAPPPDELRPPGCNCIDGYLRNKDDICIPRDQCPTRSEILCPNPNEVLDEPTGCRCQDGYDRDDEGNCVLFDDCLPECTGPNEVSKAERIICPPQSCESLYRTYGCPPRAPEPGCDCKDGYLRNSENICILSEKCPPNPPALPECGVNETYSDKKITCPPQSCEAHTGLVNYLCALGAPEPGCNCKDGFLRDANDVCISVEECPPGPGLQIVCGPNEVESDTKIICPPQTCEAIGRQYKCKVTQPERGCNCINGHLRDAKGVCIPEKKCPKQNLCPKPNEVWDDCLLACPPRKCGINDALVLCAADQPCEPAGCRCQDGYYRNDKGYCVLFDDCLKVKCGKNSTFRECTSACPATCKPNLGACIAVCKPPGCECNKGYVLHKGECILPKNCPAEPGKCGKNSTYRECMSACPATCKQPKPSVCPAVCKPAGCACNKGYVLHEGECILPKNCPAPVENCGANSTYTECTSACPATCEPYDVPCPAVCNPPGCQCNTGYVLHKGKCILKKECPAPTCPPNETYVYCNVGCPTNYCPKSDSRGIIACDPPRPCPPGCACQAGYKRKSREDPTCIKYNECPPVKCTRPHEVWNAKPPNCIRDRCEDATNPRPCEWDYPNYTPQCVCEKGYYRNASDICVPAAKCPGFGQCGKNSTYSECTSACPATCKPSAVACILSCQPPGCVCKEGYVLHDGKCILKSDCPAPVKKCGENSTYRNCTSACPATCEPNDGPCPAVCKPPGCQCNKGYVLHKGKCILKKECPAPVKKCGENSTYRNCTSACPATCEPNDGPCPAVCKPPGCQCNKGYVLHKGKCILKKECPAPVKKCGENSTYRNCTSACPATCEPNDGPCPAVCKPPGCQCNKGYVLHKGKCILKKECPAPVKKCGENSTYRNCTSACPATCEPNDGLCPAVCKPPGCQCNKGYVLHKGKCILKKECPVKNCGENSTYRNCTSACPATCEPNYGPCPAVCKPPGCQCNKGYVLHKGKCILKKECPTPVEKCCANSTYSECTSACPATCKPSAVACILSCQPPGCVCKEGYVLHDGKCILKSDCPAPVKKCGENSTYRNCTSACPATCEPNDGLCPAVCKPPGCQCNKGYVLHKGKCILKKECPVKKCGENSTYRNCTSACPATCEPNYGPCPAVCKPPGCQCNKGYVLHKGKCILKKECPTPVEKCCANSTYSECTSACPATCKPSAVACILSCQPPGCVCKEGYVLHDGKCILKSDCPAPVKKCGENSTYKDCTSACPATCEQPKPTVCIDMCKPPGCECNEGYVLHEGNCILAGNCPAPTCPANETYVKCNVGCPTNYCPKSDSRFIIACSPPYPCPPGCACQAGYKRKSTEDPTCIKYNECPPVQCTRPHEVWDPKPPNCITDRCKDVLDPKLCNRPYPNYTPQCVCEAGYFRNDSDICVPLLKCPGTNCPANETFAFCKAGCPTDFCSKEEYPPNIACDQPWPCPGGCVCKAGYKRKSETENVCVKISDCAPVTCTKPNEIWTPNPPNCVHERCEDATNPRPCERNYPNYMSQCMCREGFYRNASDICVPKAECPIQCPIPEQCRPTCAVPNPPNCPKSSPAANNVDGCECKAGFVLSEIGGKCVGIQECPQNQGCNGDPFAVPMACPWPCPSSCCSPESSTCGKTCEPVGCTCQSGYMLSDKTGKCILATECPGGDPCGPNGTFVDCGFRCPNQYCPRDDSLVKIACKPGRPCPPGCACKTNYLRKSYEKDVCVLARECPEVECTRDHEEWNPCTTECLAEGCENRFNNQSDCDPELYECQPKCVCKKDYFRDSSDNCVPADQSKTKLCSSKCTPTCAVPNPPNCPQPSYNEKQCCESGYILDKIGGECIPIEKCPKKVGCNGDPNAVTKACPRACVPSTCKNPESQQCPVACSPGCECAPGYILSDTNRTCIKVEECPGGDPCGPNAFFVNCKNSCPTDYCPIDDRRATVICETSPFAPCFSGCVCKLNHKLNNRKEKKCIVSSDCMPVPCTRPAEEWSPCPSGCQSEYCEAAGMPPVQCQTLLLNCQPRCICQKNHFRNATDICIPALDCVK